MGGLGYAVVRRGDKWDKWGDNGETQESPVHRYDVTEKTFEPVHGAGGVSAARSEAEGTYGWAWAQSIWSDMLG